MSAVTSPRVLAVRAEPAEVAPGEAVALSALYADARGALTEGPLDWAFCTERKPLTEAGPVAPACLRASGPSLVALGVGPGGLAAGGSVPRDACRLFGPDRPDPRPGETAGRPVDPDPTGGFYQPVRLRADVSGGDGVAARVDYTVFGLRVACGLSGVTQEVRASYERDYVRNANPRVAGLARAFGDGAPLEDGAVVPAGSRLAIRASWPACDEAAAGESGEAGAPAGCEGAERYAYLDPDARALLTKREAMTLAWYATGGAFAEERTGRGEADVAVSSDNAWTAPGTPGDATLFVVLRDDRGGAAFRALRVRVE